MKKDSQTTVLKWSLILGIIIVLNLFFNYAISLVYPAPDSDLYFGAQSSEECTEVGGEWIEHKPLREEPVMKEVSGYCDSSSAYNEAREPYERNLFIALVVLGVLSLFVGLSLSSYPIVANGLSFGGVLSLVIGSMRYWSSAEDIVRLLILAIALAVLFWLGITKFRE